MDVHNNYDSVFKEALVLFKDKTLNFLGLNSIAPIAEPLRTESVQVEVTTEILDLTFGLQDGRGAHFEEEINLSYDDLLRFGSYNISLSRIYKREFITIIFVKEPTNIKEIQTEQLCFTPIIVQCSNIDADAMLTKLKEDIATGNPINELELIYLPIFHSKKYSPTELFKESTVLIKNMKIEDGLKKKIFALLVVLAGKVVEKSELDAFLEEVKFMSNVILEYLEEKIAVEKQEEIAQKMIDKGYDSLDIIEITGISPEHLRSLRDAAKNKVV